MYFHKDSELFLYLQDMKENVPVIYAAPLQGYREIEGGKGAAAGQAEDLLGVPVA